MSIDSVSICFVLEPFALKYIAINVPEFSSPTGLVEPPETLVTGTIGPDLDTEAMLHVT